MDHMVWRHHLDSPAFLLDTFRPGVPEPRGACRVCGEQHRLRKAGIPYAFVVGWPASGFSLGWLDGWGMLDGPVTRRRNVRLKCVDVGPVGLALQMMQMMHERGFESLYFLFIGRLTG